MLIDGVIQGGLEMAKLHLYDLRIAHAAVIIHQLFDVQIDLHFVGCIVDAVRL